jgi:homoserine kinase
MYNTLELVPADKWQLTIHGQGEGHLPQDPNNLVWRAMVRLWQEIRTPVPVVNLSMTNRIPLGRGLGSSAAAIVGGLVAANEWAGQPLSRDELLQLAVELEGHPDNVAPALLGGLTVSVMDGNRPMAVNMAFPGSIGIVACIPEFVLATAKLRAALPKTVPHGDGVFNLSRTALLVAALTQGRGDLLNLACEDRLHQPYRKPLVPGFDEVVQAAKAAGATACMLSGAGPTMLTLVPGGVDSDRIGSFMVQAFAQTRVKARYEVLSPDLTGARII